MPKDRLPPHIPYNKSLSAKARELRIRPTPPEKLFWNALRSMPWYPDFKFNRQKPLGNYIVDFYCHQLRLVVEIDGDSHWEEKEIARDKTRTAFLESHGLTVLRFANRDATSRINGVMLQLEEVIETRKHKN